MKLVNTSVKRPVGVIMIVLAVLALGFVSMKNLVLDLFPKIDLPIAVVATSYEDAAPQEVENQVSRPIESSVSSVEGIDSVQTQSKAGSSLVLMQFKNGTDLDQALTDVREKIDQAKGALPDDTGDPNVMRFNPDDTPVMWVGVTGKDQASLTKLTDDQIKPYFERQKGVASVQVDGGKEREIQLVLNQAKLQQHKLSADDVVQALNGSNQSASAGSVDKGDKDLQIRVTGEFKSLDAIKQTIIQNEDGDKFHVEDVAKLKDTYANNDQETLVNGKPSLVLSFMKKTDGNVVQVADNVRDSLDDIKKDLPDGVDLDVIMDTSDFITLSIHSVTSNIILGGIISILILLLFLKSVRATLVIGISIPIAIISTFALMYFTGQTLNVLTLGGLALGLGMMVDSSIVILENIYSYRQRGYSLFESATKGASELAPAVIASTTTTVVVFLPIIYVKGIASDLFTPLALTVSFSLIASLIVSVTLVPMLSSKLLSKAMEDNGRRYWFDQVMKRVNNGYRHVLRWVLGHRKTTIFGTLAAIILSLGMTPLLGAELIPSSDQGQVQIDVDTPPGSSLKTTKKVVEQVNEKLSDYKKDIKTSFADVGSDDLGTGSSANQASYTMQLVPASDRSQTTDQIVQAINDDLQDIAGADIKVSAADNVGELGDPVQIQLKGTEHDKLQDLSERVVDEISKVKGVYNPESSADDAVPQQEVKIDKEKAASYGLTQEQVSGQIQTFFTGQVATKYRESGEEMDVKLIYPKKTRQTIHDLEDMTIQTPQGSDVSLDNIADLKEVQGPETLTREDQQPQLNVTSELHDRDLGSVTSDIKDRLDKMEFPEGYSYDMGGQAEDMTDSFKDLAIALVFSIFLVYAVMAIQFENFLFPFIIMFAMPATVIGIVLGLFVTGIPLSIPAFIGIIMLAGIVVNNSIVLVDYINILRGRGMDRFEAIIKAGPNRLRPILMTTLTTILGMVPLALALGEGSETQQPLAVTIIFGLGVSSIFTLLLIPVIYTLFDDLTGKITRRKKKKKNKKEKKSTES